MTQYSPHIRWGSIILFLGALIIIFSGIFLLRNEKEIIAAYKRKQLTPEEILIVAQEQYKLEQRDRLQEVVLIRDSLRLLTISNLQQRNRINELSQRVTLLEKSAVVDERKIKVNDTERKKTLSQMKNKNPIQEATLNYLNHEAKSLNLLNPKYDATVAADSTGNWNILYYSPIQKRYIYYHPIGEKSIAQ